MACYDFPEIVIHDARKVCGRYTGGVCMPLPMPVPPYTEEEAIVMVAYREIMAQLTQGNGTYTLQQIEATGHTIYPDGTTDE